jgi:hypothetical protein
VLLRTLPPPSTDAFQFVVVLRSQLGVLLSKVVSGNDEMSWAVSSDDFLLTPDRN